MFVHVQFTRTDPVQALRWWKATCLTGHPQACPMKGRCHGSGTAVQTSCHASRELVGLCLMTASLSAAHSAYYIAHNNVAPACEDYVFMTLRAVLLI